MSVEDDMARMRQQADQASAGSAEFAGVVGAFYGALCVDGVPQEHAVQLTLHWMSLMSGAPDEDDE